MLKKEEAHDNNEDFFLNKFEFWKISQKHKKHIHHIRRLPEDKKLKYLELNCFITSHENIEEVRHVILEYTMPHVNHDLFSDLCSRYPVKIWGDKIPTMGLYTFLFNEKQDSLISLH